jgi:tellurium resistance protein TerD
MTEIAKGANVPVAATAVRAELSWTARPGAPDVDGSALLLRADGKVAGDDDFVFYNQPHHPNGAVRHAGKSGTRDVVEVDLAALPSDVDRVVLAASADGGTFGAVPDLRLALSDLASGAPIATFAISATEETAMVSGELYRRAGQWKFRAVGQGYAAGLAGIAADYGVTVPEDASPVPAPAPAAAPAAHADAPLPPVPQPPAAPYPAPAARPPADPYRPPVPPNPPAAAAPVPDPAFPASPYPTGSSSVTCFFDPHHGPGTTTVTWSPQWGVPRPVQTCAACAQRVQTTVPPFYTPPQQGYPQQGYPQQGYPQPYADHDHHHHHDGGGRRFGAGALIGAGAAGLIGGALLNEAFDDDEPDVVVNNFYED